ncbi:MAG: tRNA (guanosine(37)-N1)-methyltransferase TrmD [Candidatus Gracilibacteria bacterium]|nr:tRNA (guanosine(37)-N1)-methyltransferase TrmD [Candidatus Gracilibacteria bacterium]
MKIHILTMFPDSFSSYFKTSILRIAQEKGIFEPIIYNLCDFSVKNTRRVDSRPYGGFPGTIISAEPLYDAINSIEEKHGKLEKIYLSPRGEMLKQQTFEKLAKNEKDLILICGHYEGIDQRIIEIFGIKEISIGNYVLSGGELASMVLIDGIVRLLPQVISEKSLEEESFSKKLKRKKEYPQYSRPEDFLGIKVPKELLSGDPKEIEKWKKKFIS